MAASLTFLTPLAGLLAPLALVPLAALAVAARRVRRARTLLRLPGGRDLDWPRTLALAAVPLLLALGIMQPALRSQGSQAARSDAARTSAPTR
jgi:hypothetical protein